MKLLFITTTSLEPEDGGAIRSGCLRSALMEVGSVDTLLVHIGPQASDDGGWREGRVRRMAFVKRGWFRQPLGGILQRRRRVAGILENERYDAIVVRYVSTALLVPFRYWGSLVIDADDLIRRIPSGEGASRSRRIKIRLRNALAVRIVPWAAHVWFVNRLDRPLLKTRRATYLGNVIPLPARQRLRREAVSGRILMVGLLTYKPNVDGLLWFARAVLPALAKALPGVELHAVGKHFPDLCDQLNDPRVVLRGFVKELAAEYDQACVVVAPVHSGGGTQMKVIEALAHSRPLVVSRFAHSGFADTLRDREHLLVAASPEEWISHCQLLLTQRRVAAALAAHGCCAMEGFGAATMAAVVKETMSRMALAAGTWPPAEHSATRAK